MPQIRWPMQLLSQCASKLLCLPLQAAGSVSIDIGLRECNAPASDAVVTYNLVGRGQNFGGSVPLSYIDNLDLARFITLVPVPPDVSVRYAASQSQACQDVANSPIENGLDEVKLKLTIALCATLAPEALPICPGHIQSMFSASNDGCLPLSLDDQTCQCGGLWWQFEFLGGRCAIMPCIIVLGPELAIDHWHVLLIHPPKP